MGSIPTTSTRAMIHVTDISLHLFVDKLERAEPFSFVRYGDGEWSCILQCAQRTGSGSQKLDIPKLQELLAEGVVNAPHNSNYFLALQSVGFLERKGLLKRIEPWLVRNCTQPVNWCNGEVFHRASMKGKLYPLVEQLRKMEVVVVGPHWLKRLDRDVFPYVKFIEVSTRDCFAQHVGITKEILKSPEGSVISFSAGPTTKVLIYTLYPELGSTNFLIDFGSLWDIYCGKSTRRYHKRVTPEVRRINLMGV